MNQVNVVIGKKRFKFASMRDAVGAFRWRIIGRRAADLSEAEIFEMVKAVLFIP